MSDIKPSKLLGVVLIILLTGCVKPQITKTENDVNLQPPPTITVDAGPEPEPEPEPEVVPEPEPEPEPEVVPEPEPKEVKVEDLYSAEDKELAMRIYYWKRTYDKKIWFECGLPYTTTNELQIASLEWAKAINDAYHNTTYQLRSGKTIKVRKRGVIGTIMSESRFDRCAIGPHPRKFAYERGIVKRRNRTITHTLDEIQKIVEHPKFRGRRADIGPGQIVKRLGEGYMTFDELKDWLSVDPGVQRVFDEMAKRGRMYNTKKPWERWPGSQRHVWYDVRIMRYAGFLFTRAVTKFVNQHI